MQLKCFRHLWGIPQSGVKWQPEQLFPLLKRLGYDGIELSLSDLKSRGVSQIMQTLQNENMEMIIGIYSGWTDYELWDEGSRSVGDHIAQFSKELDEAQSFDPVHINSHSGSDHWNMDKNLEFFGAVAEIEKDLQSRSKLSSISHETHRGRIFSTPWTTMEVLEKYPDLRLTLDFSHWCISAERMLDTPFDEEWLKKIVPHVAHIHGRIGTPQSPQVISPSLDSKSTDRFDRLWTQIWEYQHCHEKFSIFTPEYGPDPYTPLDSSNSPLSDVWDVCNEENARQKKRFSIVFPN